jgi:hypothetical protein
MPPASYAGLADGAQATQGGDGNAPPPMRARERRDRRENDATRPNRVAKVTAAGRRSE